MSLIDLSKHLPEDGKCSIKDCESDVAEIFTEEVKGREQSFWVCKEHFVFLEKRRQELHERSKD